MPVNGYEIDWPAVQAAWSYIDTYVRLGLGAAVLACTGEGALRNIVRGCQFVWQRWQSFRAWLARPSHSQATAAKVDVLEGRLTALLVKLGEQTPVRRLV